MSSDSDFVVENGVLEKYIGSGGNVVIPVEVKRIGSQAFYGCESLSSVIIPETTFIIGAASFSNCTKAI